MVSLPLSFELALEIRVQYELERIQSAVDRSLLEIYGESVYGLLEDRHYSRLDETATDRVSRIAFNASTADPIPVFIRSVPELVDAWKDGLAARRDYDEEAGLEDFDPAFESREATYYS